MTLKPIMIAAMIATGMAWAGPKTTDVSVVRLSLRDGREILGRVQSYRNGSYVIAQSKGPVMVVAATDLRTMEMAPDTKAPVPKPAPPTFKQPTQQDLFQLAIEELRKENKEKRRQRMEAAKGDVSQLGLGNILNKLSEDVEDNLLDFVAKDKELQNILLDDTVQKSVENKDLGALMSNDKILNLMRNPDKVKKLVGAVMGDDDDKKKKEGEKNKGAEKK